MFKGPVPGFFSIIGKAASGQLATFQMIAQAFAADPFASTGVICAVTSIETFFFAAFHRRPLPFQNEYFFRLSLPWKTKMIKTVLFEAVKAVSKRI